MPRLTRATVRILTPATPPPPLFPRLSDPTAFIAAQNLPPIPRRIFEWVSALQNFTEDNWRNLSPVIEPDSVTYGFIPIAGRSPPDVKVHNEYVFGVCVEKETPDVRDARQSIETFAFAERQFPLVINFRPFERHIVEVGVGTATCWSRSDSAPFSEGVLTAAHCLASYRRGDLVKCSLPGDWRFANAASAKIDAALVSQSGAIPPHAARLPVMRHPVPSLDVAFLGAATRKRIYASVTHALVHPSTLSAMHPMRVFMDAWGQPGDSGALVEDDPFRHGVGIYMGAQPIVRDDGLPDSEGVSQLLAQAVMVLGLDLSKF